MLGLPRVLRGLPGLGRHGRPPSSQTVRRLWHALGEQTIVGKCGLQGHTRGHAGVEKGNDGQAVGIGLRMLADAL